MQYYSLDGHLACLPDAVYGLDVDHCRACFLDCDLALGCCLCDQDKSRNAFRLCHLACIPGVGCLFNLSSDTLADSLVLGRIEVFPGTIFVLTELSTCAITYVAAVRPLCTFHFGVCGRPCPAANP